MKLLTTLFILLVISSCHVGRYIVYNFSDHTDYKKFNYREIDAPTETFVFPENMLDEPKVYPESEYESFGEYLDDKKSVSYAVIRNDTLIYEWYNKKYNDSSIVTSFSMAKSLVSLLIGCAVDEGKIKSIDDPIINYLPELTAEGADKITIRDVLNMSSGFDSNEGYYNPFGEVAKFYYGRRLKDFVHALEMDQEPGKNFRYRSSDSQILGLIIESATGKKLANYMEEKFWSKMDMQYDATWSIDSKKHDTEKAFCCLNARTIDIAKFGKLMLQKGKWKGEQLVSESYLNEIFTQRSPYKGYSLQWWFYNNSDEAYFAQGHLGQYLYINPAKNMVIVRFGKSRAKVSWERNLSMVAEYFSSYL